MQRRTYLAAAGSTLITGLAGCLNITDTEPDDAPSATNEYDYETISTRGGPDVPLVPVTDAGEWHADENTIFVDARDETGYEEARIEDALLSPAPDGLDADDPVEDYDTSTRIVTYCVCPHRLAGMRGASLIENGYVNTYALDEGLDGWHEADQPLEGNEVESRPAIHEIGGKTSTNNADELAWARHEPTGQREATTISSDGSFTLHVQFHDITETSELTVEVPGAEHTNELQSLIDTTVEL